VVKNPKRAWLIFGLIGGGAGMVIVGLIIYFVMAANRAGSPSGASKILDVTRTASSGASGYRTVMDALRAAQPGDTIQLHDPEHFENLHIELPRMRGEIVSDVTIRVAPGKEVIWRPLRKEEDVPILHLQNAQSLKIEGRGLTFDGALDANKRLKNLIVVNFTSPGLTLDGATLKGFSRSGVNIVNVFGSKDRPVRLANLIVIGAAPEAEAGLLFDANPDVQPPFSDHFVLADLHLHGVKEGIKKVDNTVVGKNIKWPR